MRYGGDQAISSTPVSVVPGTTIPQVRAVGRVVDRPCRGGADDIRDVCDRRDRRDVPVGASGAGDGRFDFFAGERDQGVEEREVVLPFEDVVRVVVDRRDGALLVVVDDAGEDSLRGGKLFRRG
jgi:hypothetical protein